METFPALLALRAGNSLVTGEIPSQRPVTRSFDVFFDLCLNKRLCKQSWGCWFETPSRPLWRHRNAVMKFKTGADKSRCKYSYREHVPPSRANTNGHNTNGSRTAGTQTHRILFALTVWKGRLPLKSVSRLKHQIVLLDLKRMNESTNATFVLHAVGAITCTLMF